MDDLFMVYLHFRKPLFGIDLHVLMFLIPCPEYETNPSETMVWQGIYAYLGACKSCKGVLNMRGDGIYRKMIATAGKTWPCWVPIRFYLPIFLSYLWCWEPTDSSVDTLDTLKTLQKVYLSMNPSSEVSDS